eukprot:scaffold47354_cov69-Phaeocystis_antarctica.AAC.2
MLAKVWGSLRHDLALTAASGAPAGRASIGLLPGDGLIVVNGQKCVDVQQVERTITGSMSCSLKVKRGLPDAPSVAST